MRVAWFETDASGRIHWSAPFRWAEAAEHALLRVLIRSEELFNCFPRRAANVVYLAPLTFGDELEVQLMLGSLGHTSITYEWKIIHDGQTAVSGSHTVVHINANGRSSPWPDSFREALCRRLEADDEERPPLPD